MLMNKDCFDKKLVLYFFNLIFIALRENFYMMRFRTDIINFHIRSLERLVLFLLFLLERQNDW